MTYEQSVDIAIELSNDAHKALQDPSLTPSQKQELQENLQWFNETILKDTLNTLATEPCALWEYSDGLLHILHELKN